MISSHNFDRPHYLKSQTIAEPLIDRWYAWSYLISPVTAALYLTNSHIPLLESFVNAPQVHVSALNDPKMRGGPFINYPIDQQPEIQQLLAQTQHQQQDLLQLATAIHQLQKQLQTMQGASLEPLYATMPEGLKGYVELVYDLHHHASFRLFEPLLYASRYYQASRQSISLMLGDVDRRDFVLSTPRLPQADRFELNLPFQHPGLDTLFAMRDRPQRLDLVMDSLEIDPILRSQFAQYFTVVSPDRSVSRYLGEGVRIRYMGHACILIETSEVSILCDPLISYENPEGISRYSYADLPDRIDYALITHHHQDHVMLETLLQLRHKIGTVIVPQNNPGSLIDPSLKLILQQIGFKNVRSLDELETLEIADGRITGLPVLGEHGDLNIAAKLAYHIQIKHQSIICAADSNNISPELYTYLHNWLGPIDVLFIGMECEGAPYSWAYGPLLPQAVPRSLAQTRRLNGSNADRAISLVQQLQPEQVYVYAMGQEPWLTFITSIQYEPDSVPIQESDRLVQYCRSQGLCSDRLFGQHEIELAARSSPPVERLIKPDLKPTMKPITDLLFQLQSLDVQLHLDRATPDPILRCNAPKGALSDALKLELKSRKVEIIAFLNNQLTGVPEAPQMLSDTELDPQIKPAQTTTNNAIPNILLTGATGFVGAFLLAELLQTTSAKIHCLVRAEDNRAAWQHLQASLTQYDLWEEHYRSRLVLHRGDLAQANLGLDSETFTTLAEQIDVVYHNGAWVHHLLPYKTLRTTNVLGTQSIIAFASQGCRKIIHHISSSSVFTTAGKVGVIDETQLLDVEQLPKTGYAQTKWASERLMEQARDRGFDIQIFRLGGISGHSKTGQFNANDFLYRLLIGVVQLGSYPIDRPMPLRMLPIDYVVKAIVQLSQSPENCGKTHHLIHPHPVDVGIMFQQLTHRHYALKPLSYNAWRGELLQIAQSNSQHPLYPLVALLPKTAIDTLDIQSDGANLEFATDRTQAALAMPPPMIAAPLIDVYIDHLIQQNLIPQTGGQHDHTNP